MPKSPTITTTEHSGIHLLVERLLARAEALRNPIETSDHKEQELKLSETEVAQLLVFATPAEDSHALIDRVLARIDNLHTKSSPAPNDDASNSTLLMRWGGNAHAADAFETALACATLAYLAAEPRSIEQGRAARDMAFRCAKIDQLDRAEQWATHALEIHEETAQDKNSTTLRELAATESAIVALALRRYEKDNDYVMTQDEQTCANNALTHITSAEKMRGGSIDQYHINMLARLSMFWTIVAHQRNTNIESNDLDGTHELYTYAFKLALQAIVCSLESESPTTLYSADDLSTEQRLRAKQRSLTRGIAALGANVSYRSGGHTTHLGGVAVKKLVIHS